MWSRDPVASEDLLRQGDLISEWVYPVADYPFRFIGPEGGQPGKGSDLVLRAAYRSLLVVSQCCEIEHGGTVAVAPIKRQNIKKEEAREAYLAVDPVPGRPFIYSGISLDPVAHLAEHEFQVYFADFSEIFSILGAESALRNKRVARMTPEGRLRLRTKLLHFWSRVEWDDAVALGLEPPSAEQFSKVGRQEDNYH